MPVKVLVPRLGEGVDELTLVKWLKKEGDPVNELEPLLEVETDKVVTEIPSPASGTLLKIMVPENTPAGVGTLIAWIGQPEESASLPGLSAVPEPASESVAPVSEIQPAVNPLPSTVHTGSGFLSPLVRKLAAEHNLELSKIMGTGLGGRITKQDVLAYLAHPPSPIPASAPVPGKHDAGLHTTETLGAGTRDMDGESLIFHTSMRRSIAEHMLASKKTSPHVLTVMEVDLSRVLVHRAANRETFSRDGVNLTLTAYFIAAIVAGLKAQPLANSSWTDEGILVHKAINIGMAVALGDAGLIVPVIKHADGLSLLGIARSVNDLAYRAREHKLQPEEVRGGTFTLTNHGTGGSLFAMPIINQPQAGILGVGTMQKRVIAVTDTDGNDLIAIRPMVYLSFVFDHRILDGASADAFLLQLKQTLDNWE